MAWTAGPAPDFSDTDSEDDYISYRDKPEKVKIQYTQRILTPEEILNRQKNQLYSAICNKATETVLELINNGLDVNIQLQNNWTPLLLAVSNGNAQLTEELLKRGVDPNSVRDGCTALMMACNCPKETSPYEDSLKVVKYLVEKGADVKAINRKRMTPLMFAANAGNLPVVKYLLPLSDKNAVDNQKWSALFWAVNNNELEVCNYLLEEGLEYTSVDVRNNTPLDIARDNDFIEILELFPKEENNEISNIINDNILSFKDIFSTDAEPNLFIDICDLLCGMKSEHLIKYFSDSGITLNKFLTITDEELENIGIKLPYQRYRILAGLHKFHKHPFIPKSLHVVPLTEPYSNVDAGIQILSAIKQFICMEAGLKYIMSNCDMDNLSEEDLVSMKTSVDNIKNRIRMCDKLCKKIYVKTKRWDMQNSPADLITKESMKYKWPLRKIIFSITVVTIFIYKLRTIL